MKTTNTTTLATVAILAFLTTVLAVDPHSPDLAEMFTDTDCKNKVQGGAINHQPYPLQPSSNVHAIKAPNGYIFSDDKCNNDKKATSGNACTHYDDGKLIGCWKL